MMSKYKPPGTMKKVITEGHKEDEDDIEYRLG